MEYLKKRLSERSTKIGLLVLGVGVLKLLFPDLGGMLDQLTILLGGAAAAVPDNQPKTS